MRITKELFDKLPKKKQEEYKKEVENLKVNDLVMLDILNKWCNLTVFFFLVLFFGLPLYVIAFGNVFILPFVLTGFLLLRVGIWGLAVLFIVFLLITLMKIVKLGKIREKYFKVEVK